MSSTQHHVIFIDGICVLCNRLSRILIRLDSKKQFLLSTLDSPCAKKTLPKHKEDSIMVFSQKGMIYTKSNAILFIIRQLPYVKWIGILFQIIPTFIRDHLYDRIAANRYRWFGKHDICPLQTHDRFVQ
ncbi:MAG: DCC1-like thiol-disulfide oxidoreductase family protein [Flavobacteriaceae bacterium]|jgi:predicted DCC family thiol-disulfide oxidoreductase YuxK|nr:DCC1-like thiol-disulfide oxidoreductase family protein [Flavobacteriaceae bacterium]